jgi:preprotein translocase subunit SecB
MTDSQQPVFNIEKVYVKDASIESPNSPQVFLEPAQPQVEVQLQNGVQRLNDALFEVVVTVTVTAKAGEKTLFLVEAAQAGIFRIQYVPEADLEPILGVGCPNILFPYARWSPIHQARGVPAIHLQPVNFEAMYAARLEARRRSRARASRSRIEVDGALRSPSLQRRFLSPSPREFRSIGEAAVVSMTHRRHARRSSTWRAAISRSRLFRPTVHG